MPPKKRANNNQLQDHMPLGEVLEDVHKKKWKLGNPIGKGGFGLIYLAQEFNEMKNNTDFPYVVKIEPHGNGPLFVEMNFLMRNAKQDDISVFMKENKLKSLGMPRYISSGSHTVNKEKYRFLVLERFGEDILKLFLESKKEFPVVTVFKVALQIVDVLEYIHARGYVHHDIKGANILLDLKNKKQIYLMDYGLTGRYFTGTKFKRDPKKAHDGTLEYVSRDGHDGVQTRRGDLEVLGYNLIQWLGCTLPWESVKSPAEVQTSKTKFMEDIPNLMKTCFKNKEPPKALIEYFTYLNNLNFDAEPDYKNIKKIFVNGVKSNGGTIESPLVFKQSKTPIKGKVASETPSSGKKAKLPRRKLNVDDNVKEEEEEETKPNKKRMGKKNAKTDDIEENGNEKVKPERSRKKINHANVDEEVENDKPKKKSRKVENVEEGEDTVEAMKPKRKTKKVENVEDGENTGEVVKPQKRVRKVEKVEDGENTGEVVKPKKRVRKVEKVEDDETAMETVKLKKKIGNGKRNIENQEEIDEENEIKIKPSKKTVEITDGNVEEEKPSSSRYPKRAKK